LPLKNTDKVGIAGVGSPFRERAGKQLLPPDYSHVGVKSFVSIMIDHDLMALSSASIEHQVPWSVGGLRVVKG
jgi:hypothetical protein